MILKLLQVLALFSVVVCQDYPTTSPWRPTNNGIGPASYINKKNSPNKICPRGSTGLKPHPTKCQKFYNCDDNTAVFMWEAYLWECPINRLFNAETKRCEHYSMVKCGKRKEPISPCDYESTKCPVAHCIPCYVFYPSCKNLPDGLNPWQWRENSPYFVVCKNNRTVYEGRCPSHRGIYLFDANLRACYVPPSNY